MGDADNRPRERLVAEVLTPATAGYEEARRVCNGMIDHRPQAIARCRGVTDGIEAVRFAAAHDRPVSVWGGGHNAAGTAVADGAHVADLSPKIRERYEPAGLFRGHTRTRAPNGA